MKALPLVCIATLLVAGCTSSNSSAPIEVPSTSATSVTASTPVSPTAEPPPSLPTPTSRAEVAQSFDELVRPVADPSVCETYAATEQTLAPDAEPLTLFARSSAEAVPIQIIANKATGPAGPFAVVQRFPDSDDTPTGVEPLVIEGSDVFVSAFDNGNAEATWSLDDGSQGYLRARGLSRDDVVEIVSSLSPRPGNDPVPGFDHRPTGELEVLVDQLNTDQLTGSAAGSQCRVIASGSLCTVSVVRGDELVLYASVIDRSPPIEVGYRDGVVVIIGGLEGSDAPTVADVVNADPDTWRSLLDSE